MTIDFLAIDQNCEAFVEAQPGDVGLRQLRLERARHAGQAQRAEFFNTLMQHRFSLS